MVCVSYDFDMAMPGGIGRAVILADETPSVFPLNTAGLAGFPAVNVPIPPISLLIVVDSGKFYIMNESGTEWIEWAGGQGTTVDTLTQLLEGTITHYENPTLTTVKDGLFGSSRRLISVDLPAVVTLGTYAFSYCPALPEIELPVCQTIGNSAFATCTNLARAYMPQVRTIGKNAFAGCTKLTEFVIEQDTAVCSVQSTSFDAGVDFYVPDSLVDAYKADSVWSAWASHIFPISQKP
jgi:hypothetical protein